ncbi:MAG: hypothetical protein QOF83_1369 [Solirubrobacteraceae bacterium]|nr:hypothetical protein [Solirubrobacteraceae bacterium]
MTVADAYGAREAVPGPGDLNQAQPEAARGQMAHRHPAQVPPAADQQAVTSPVHRHLDDPLVLGHVESEPDRGVTERGR